MCYQKTSEDELENGLENSHTASLPYPVSSLCCSFLLMDCIKGNTKQGSFLHHHKWNKLPQVKFDFERASRTCQEPGGEAAWEFYFVKEALPLLFLPPWTPTDLELAAPG